jgi:hypothetical protein
MNLAAIENILDRGFLCRINSELVVVLDLNPCPSISADETAQGGNPLCDIYPQSWLIIFQFEIFG